MGTSDVFIRIQFLDFSIDFQEDVVRLSVSFIGSEEGFFESSGAITACCARRLEVFFRMALCGPIVGVGLPGEIGIAVQVM